MTREFGRKDSQLTAMTTDPLGNFLYAADGNNDEILVYWINTTSGVFEDAKVSNIKVGARPVDITFHPGGKWAYVVNNKDSTINTFSVDHLYGNLDKKLQTLKTEKSPLDLQVDASGRFAYLIYQDSNKLTLYSVDPATGQIKRQNDLRNDGVITDMVIDTAIHQNYRLKQPRQKPVFHFLHVLAVLGVLFQMAFFG